MKRIKEWFVNEEKRSVMLLIISGISLVVSFFDIGHLPVNAAWVAIALCGIPILLEAAEGLITRFDIKADVLVSLALIASVVIGEIFAAGEVAFIMQIARCWSKERLPRRARALKNSLSSLREPQGWFGRTVSRLFPLSRYVSVIRFGCWRVKPLRWMVLSPAGTPR